MKRRLMFVKKVSKRCPFPGNGVELSEAGAWVPKNAYWMRRLRDGDCVETDPPKQKPKSESKPSAPRKPSGPEKKDS